MRALEVGTTGRTRARVRGDRPVLTATTTGAGATSAGDPWARVTSPTGPAVACDRPHVHGRGAGEYLIRVQPVVALAERLRQRLSYADALPPRTRPHLLEGRAPPPDAADYSARSGPGSSTPARWTGWRASPQARTRSFPAPGHHRDHRPPRVRGPGGTGSTRPAAAETAWPSGQRHRPQVRRGSWEAGTTMDGRSSGRGVRVGWHPRTSPWSGVRLARGPTTRRPFAAHPAR